MREVGFDRGSDSAILPHLTASGGSRDGDFLGFTQLSLKPLRELFFHHHTYYAQTASVEGTENP